MDFSLAIYYELSEILAPVTSWHFTRIAVLLDNIVNPFIFLQTCVLTQAMISLLI